MRGARFWHDFILLLSLYFSITHAFQHAMIADMTRRERAYSQVQRYLSLYNARQASHAVLSRAPSGRARDVTRRFPTLRPARIFINIEMRLHA